MTNKRYEAAGKLHLTSSDSTSVKSDNTGQKKYLLGVFVSQASNTPTLAISDDFSPIMAQLTPVAGTFYRLPCVIDGQLAVAIGGTVDCTVFFGSE